MKNLHIKDIGNVTLFYHDKKFYDYIADKYNIGSSSARDALTDMLESGEVTKSREGFFIYAENTMVSEYVSNHIYATLLPLQDASPSTQYIEVTNNAAPFLVNLFNSSVNRNDKRFYCISSNLILMLDLAIPEDHIIMKKTRFDLEKFIRQHGITIRNYELIWQGLKGKTKTKLEEDAFNAAYELHEFEENIDYNGKLNKPRKVNPNSKDQ